MIKGTIRTKLVVKLFISSNFFYITNFIFVASDALSQKNKIRSIFLLFKINVLYQEEKWKNAIGKSETFFLDEDFLHEEKLKCFFAKKKEKREF